MTETEHRGMPGGLSQAEWDKLSSDERIVLINKQDRERKIREMNERTARTVSPAPISAIPEAELRDWARRGPPFPPHIEAHFRQFGLVIVENLPEPPRRTAGGDVPEVDGRSEAEQMLDPKNMLRRIVALEQDENKEFPKMKRILRRFLIYWIIIAGLITIFQAWPSLHEFEGQPVAFIIGEIIGYLVFGFGIWSIVFERIYWILRAFGAFKTAEKQKPGE
jgi:hypothetical protein